LTTAPAIGRVTRHDRSVRLRIGAALWLLSWFPFAVLFGVTGSARVVIWTIQVMMGLVGLVVAGSVFAAAVREVGWRHAPSMVWSSLIHGASTPSPHPSDL
jgi:hypothetical protein